MHLPGEPNLVPLFPLDAFTPASGCPHKGPMPSGTSLCCMACHASGLDHLKALRRDPRTDPKPEPKPEPEKPRKLTRKERRAILRAYRNTPEAAEFLTRIA